MHRLIVLIGLICILPKVELYTVPLFGDLKNENIPEYWEEKCRTVAGESGVTLAMDAKKANTICSEQIYAEEKADKSLDTFGERSCRVDLMSGKCLVQFFEDISPCLHDGEHEKMLRFILELHANIYNFTCTGSTITWKNAFRDSNGYRCILTNAERINQCHSSGACGEILIGLQAQARGNSLVSFESLYCGLLIEEQTCIVDVFNECGNAKSEILYQNYVEFLKELCSPNYISGSAKILTHYIVITLLPILTLTNWV
ncbi:uncharacterized protein LOC124168208 [Ischnura elegans]|uniref:uncharacterized protein LOC124168208 n=1 Tax=Ischnura elegans TaxID=197161 RepID=UPI001ED89D5F|nr:uncharacterized protein LOC124168208 [Ischnura elegans]